MGRDGKRRKGSLCFCIKPTKTGIGNRDEDEAAAAAATLPEH